MGKENTRLARQILALRGGVDLRISDGNICRAADLSDGKRITCGMSIGVLMPEAAECTGTRIEGAPQVPTQQHVGKELSENIRIALTPGKPDESQAPATASLFPKRRTSQPAGAQDLRPAPSG
jgi:hypothetical protein